MGHRVSRRGDVFSGFAVDHLKNTTPSRKISEKSAEFEPFRDILNVFRADLSQFEAFLMRFRVILALDYTRGLPG